MRVVDSKLLLSRDYSSLMEWSVAKIPKLTKDWTDFSITSPDMIWLSAACYAYDMLNYALDKKFLDNQIRFSRNLNNVLNMCNLRGVVIPGVQTSTIVLNINLHGSELHLDDTVSLPKGSTFEVFDANTLKNLVLNVTEDYSICLGDNKVTCLEGIKKSLSLSTIDFTIVGTYIIQIESMGLNSTSLRFGNDYIRKVNDAFLITDNVPSYSVHVNENNHTLLKLTPGFVALVGGRDIILDYVVSSGTLGNISISSNVVPTFKFVDDYNVDVNSSIAISVHSCGGGVDAYGLEDARSLLGTTSADVETLVINSDYVDEVKKLDHIYGCAVKSDGSNKSIYFIAGEDIADYGVTLEMLAQNIHDVLIDKVPAFTEIDVQPIIVRPVSIRLKIFLNRNELDRTGLSGKTYDLILNTMFSRSTITPGMEFTRTVIASSVESLSYSISHVLIEYPPADIQCSWNEIIKVDSLVVTFGREEK